jgi:actin-related protein
VWVQESVCVVRETPAIDNPSETFYELPDGCKISVGNVKYAVPELIFNGSALASKMPGVQSLQNVLVSSAMGCEPEARRDIVGNIVLTGGASTIPGMHERILSELTPIAPVGTRPKIACASSEERKLGPWLGGSILGSLGTFHDLWFSAAEYKEHGAKMLHRKCP